MKKQFALFLVIMGNVIWGGSFLFSKIALSYVDPVMLLALRFSTAFLSMTVLAILFCRKRNFQLKFKGKNLKPLIELSIFQPIAYFYFEANGIKLTSAVISSVIIATVPIVSIFFEAFVHKEKIPKDKLFFSILSVAGVAIAACGSENTGKTSLLGIMFLLLAIFAAIGFNYTSQKSAETFTVFERTYFMFMSGAVFYVIVSLIQNGGNAEVLTAPFADKEFLISILYLGVFSSVVAFTFINYALTILSIAETTVFNTLVTIVGITGGVFILHEPLNIIKTVGCITIILGLIGFNKEKKNAN